MASYTEATISSYNAATVPDDLGTVTATNKIQWSIIKTKLSDPLKTVIEAINTNVAAAISTITTNIASQETSLDTVESTYTTVSGRLYAPSGTLTFFMQTAAPTGWTKGSTHNNKMLRLVSGAVSTGGTTSFTSVLASRTITESNMPAHTHAWADSAQAITFNALTLYTGASLSSNTNIDGTGGANYSTGLTVSTATLSGTSDVSGTTGSAGSGTAMDFAVRYVDVIVASKD